jgi:hypothetical protein
MMPLLFKLPLTDSSFYWPRKKSKNASIIIDGRGSLKGCLKHVHKHSSKTFLGRRVLLMSSLTCSRVVASAKTPTDVTKEVTAVSKN